MISSLLTPLCHFTLQDIWCEVYNW
jgi:hypothetical protein